MKSDIEIAQNAKMKEIAEIAEQIGLTENDFEHYGNYKAKVSLDVFKKIDNNTPGKLILVTAITPTPAGEGKTTTTVGLGQALNKIGKKSIIALREPSLGPSFGIKGGAAGGGYSQVIPMEDINLHFTGDIHAVTSAHNLLAAMLDNSIHQGNPLDIDARQIELRRAMDLSERALRNIIIGLGGKINGIPRESGFDITVASELMAIMCLATDLMDLKERFKQIVVAYTFGGKPITADDLNAAGSMAVLMKEAIKPNLVQTLENTPAFIHGGPFANIAHGCNSLIATRMGLKLSEYMITEAGFGADLGAEKFFDIKCRYGGLVPDAAVVVASIRALKNHGGVPNEKLLEFNMQGLASGIANLEKQLENVKLFGIPVVVALNEFPTDRKEEIDFVAARCKELGAEFAVSRVWAAGSEGGIDLAHKVVKAANKPKKFELLYENSISIKEKIRIIATKIYGASGVKYSDKADVTIAKLENMGYGNLAVCVAKTQYSLSDNANLKGRPSGFNITIQDIRLSAGAGFIVALTGAILTMPGLGRIPAAEKIDIDENGAITGLF